MAKASDCAIVIFQREPGQCPVGVINGSDGPEIRLPFYPEKRTLRAGPAMSERCQ
jgi:hypothetical protein